MLELSEKRKIVEGFQLMPDSVVKFSATPTLEWVEGMFSFKTRLIQAARLKALGVDCVIIDKNEEAEGNWAERYDCLKFHIQKSCCQTPYLPYPDEYPAILEKPMLVEHTKRYAETFHLNLLNSFTVEGSSFNESKGTWHFKI
ncbi:hypothetical protein N7493_002880 [Penicillium malachiteum]|uniref:Uncharacterized protein n=1 Tax=Penicillium malachiteum TaxID=1324776 RepID=A0AAD6MZ37_9EURO|nr:hypothetical protein N7493_002880 [Penicillium malachiteum]